MQFIVRKLVWIYAWFIFIRPSQFEVPNLAPSKNFLHTGSAYIKSKQNRKVDTKFVIKVSIFSMINLYSIFIKTTKYCLNVLVFLYAYFKKIYKVLFSTIPPIHYLTTPVCHPCLPQRFHFPLV